VPRFPDALLDLAFPSRCPGCGREGDPVCAGCLPGLATRLDLPAGVPVGLTSGTPPPLLQLEWCAPYQGLARAALHELKYAGERRLARPLGAAVAARWARAGAGGEAFVPVPVHEERRRRRGYDQADLIARAAASVLGLPMIPALRRVRATLAQYELDRRHRARNVADAFAVVAATAPVVRGRWLVLVDDVTTTGATLASCADTLLAAGALAVSAIVVARER
jgi:ComF family protein